MPIVDVDTPDLQALREAEPVVHAARDWTPAAGRRRAERLEELVGLACRAGLHRFGSVTFHTVGTIPEIPIAVIDGHRITFARPRTQTGLAVFVACDDGCGAEVARIFRSRRDLEDLIAFGFDHCGGGR